MNKILIIDDDPTICIMLQGLLNKKGFESDIAFSANEGLKKFSSFKPNLVISDFRLPDINGLDLLKQIKSLNPHMPVIIMTSYAEIRTAVNAIKLGAYEYITKPLNPEEILVLINSAIEKSKTVEKVGQTKKIEFIRGNSPNSIQIDQYINLVAPTDMSVIIEGESGTGKEIVARRIHEASARKNRNFVAVDCGALSNELAGSELFGHNKGSFTGAITDKKGQFEFAKGGTLFLDEIGNLSYEIQIKLLRAIQEKKIRQLGSNNDIDTDVRILVATNEDLIKEVNKANFREDLYHRLNEFKISVPALRDRKEDIKLFADNFLNLSNQELNKNINLFSDEFIQKLKAYSWPGNLRELRNVIRRALLLSTGERIETSALPPEILHYQETTSIANNTTDLKLIQASTERDKIIDILREVNNNKSKAARLLNIDRKTLYTKMKQYGIEG
ncbi:sigma-54-dependent Fis family transcriptional regulator [Ancylomarina euxinus]|uniref:Sigma-54-dependent Fis family transcriptional regulator n=1 Tax=Ancylomarina euxinus TaxID=2283627 RepID=A0A425XZR7_9BACT|nr:sigma-54 dependent transcriptional regulator [Ancylomarina euxinus]MCZ4695494.1 sigma-54 dependent transcriptional regulator [Ancylomarina euxinus]MUP15688.1 response regulator [Ancylomarina euxinus]RRG20681.1 sigma-54-dependent Fis family transcriptional regulator [Ancylomarina euxinus]